MTPDQTLCDAAAGGDEGGVAAALSRGANPNAKFEGSTPALHLAIRFGNAAMVQALLNAGADPTMSYGDQSALDAARAVRDEFANEDFEGSAALIQEVDAMIGMLTPVNAGPFSMDNLCPEDWIPREPAGKEQIDLESAEFVWLLLEESFGSAPFTSEQAMAKGLGEERLERSLNILESYGVVARHGSEQFVFCVPFPEDESISPFETLNVVHEANSPLPAEDMLQRVWNTIWTEFGSREFAFDELTSLGLSRDDANTALTFLKEMGVTETVGLRRFVCRRPFGAMTESESATPDVASWWINSTSSLSDILEHATFDGRFTSGGTAALRVKVALMVQDEVNRRFPDDHPDQRLRGSTLMHLAVQYCSSTVLEQLIEQGADLDLKNSAGLSAHKLAENFHEFFSTRNVELAVKYAELIRIMTSTSAATDPVSAGEDKVPARKPIERTPKTVTKEERQRRKVLIQEAEEKKRIIERAERPWWKIW